MEGCPARGEDRHGAVFKGGETDRIIRVSQLGEAGMDVAAANRVDFLYLGADEPAREIDVVHVHVEKNAATGLYEFKLELCIFVEIAGLGPHKERLAYDTLVYQFFCVFVGWIEASYEADQKNLQGVSRGCALDGGAFVERHAHRLFDEHMQAAVERGQRLRRMVDRETRDPDRVDIGFGQHLIERLEEMGDAELCRRPIELC